MIVPSRLPPSLIRLSWARPWVMATRFSARLSAHRTALPDRHAAQATTIASRSMPIFAPNPPPTSGTITRIASDGMPRDSARVLRQRWAFWLLCHTVSLVPSKTAAVARPSMGTQATRWFTISRSTTTSASSKTVSS